MEKIAELGTKAARYWKFIVATVTPVFLVVQSAVTDDQITTDEWWKIGVAAVVAGGVFWKRNRPLPPPPPQPEI